MTEHHPSLPWVIVNAVLYVLSGVTQPILMSYATHAGLTNPKAQLNMFFYYIGPALATLTFIRLPGSKAKRVVEHSREQKLDSSRQQLLSCDGNKQYGTQDDSVKATSHHEQRNFDKEEERWPSKILFLKASGIAIFDIFAQSMVYTGNNLAGPTIFAIIYSSVTIWAALFSKLLLSRSMVKLQWAGVCLVVVGLTLTAIDSKSFGRSVFVGSWLILIGSSFHGLTYVMSEKIMIPTPNKDDSSSTKDSRKEPEHLSTNANCAIQGIVATLAFLLWQIVYTLPRLETLILAPMRESGTSWTSALTILLTITIMNYVHSVTFYSTLRYFPGGATSAGVLKGLQAVLVFVAGAYFLCEKWGGREMCWNESKFASLVVVVCGILIYGSFTEKKNSVVQISSASCNENVDII